MRLETLRLTIPRIGRRDSELTARVRLRLASGHMDQQF
jgi:hypothetical protein